MVEYNKLTNAQLIHHLKYCKVRGKELYDKMQDVYKMSEEIRKILKNRMDELEIEMAVVEIDRQKCDASVFDQILNIH